MNWAPEPLRTDNLEDIPIVTLSDEDDDDDQFVGIDEDDENAQISDESDVGLDDNEEADPKVLMAFCKVAMRPFI